MARLTSAQQRNLLRILEVRFEQNAQRHPGIAWRDVHTRLLSHPTALWSLHEMERTGGEPDVIGRDERGGQIIFCDCSAQSPAGRRSVCYDAAARESRKHHQPQTSALEMAAAMGVELLTEDEYRRLQQLGEFDTTTSSWLKTPPEIRQLGGALFGDCRYGRVFIYHNSAESYFASRGFRTILHV